MSAVRSLRALSIHSTSFASSSRLTLTHFSRSHLALSSSHPFARRAQHNLAQPSSLPSGFEGVPAPGYSGTVKASSSSNGTKEEKVGGVEKKEAEAAEKKAPAAKRREIKSKKAALTMTPEALTRLRALSDSPTGPKLLRIGVKTRGCAGMAYHLDYVDPPGGRFDEVVEQDGVRVLIDSKALFSIIGSRMDWRDNRLSAGFVFDNPNIVDTCGCGDSFNIR